MSITNLSVLSLSRFRYKRQSEEAEHYHQNKRQLPSFVLLQQFHIQKQRYVETRSVFLGIHIHWENFERAET